jgi:hypothetical protein
MEGRLQLDTHDLRVAGGLMLALGATLPLLPGHRGLPCPLRTLTGVPCPLCGMSTSVEETVRLDLGDALAANPAGIVFVAVALALLVRRPARLFVPLPLAALSLAAMWVFELHRFSIL